MTEHAATRNTIQRTLVLDAVRSLRSHPTSADVYDVVSRKHPGISRATVYRNLGVLAARGDVLRVEVPGGADRYDFRNDVHYHARCRVCGAVVDVEVPEAQQLSGCAQVPDGFIVEGHQVMFNGVCAQCAQGSNA
ncbi:Fur family transcriptional regulator [Adlercreutzia sp. ZJ138]|uniref:Fur family transcriptional regulator n=1 Tax=Adlercreutzia sp. ZJ138 TaxID=2709405 RepID=UPI0013E9E16B|nr:transcriptional repressor [Adlercreutzia sp. ZJ138]